MARWRGWWRFANIEQLTTFVLITFLTILFTSLLAYSTVYGREDLANNISFIKTEGEVLGERVGPWFQYFFWFIGAFSLFAAALGIVDYTSRLAADVLKTCYLRDANESKIYAGPGLGPGRDRHRGAAPRVRAQPIVLLVISAVVGGFMMFIYSGLLILINRKILPAPIRVRGCGWPADLVDPAVRHAVGAHLPAPRSASCSAASWEWPTRPTPPPLPSHPPPLASPSPRFGHLRLISALCSR